jgi:hypothetical protein
MVKINRRIYCEQEFRNEKIQKDQTIKMYKEVM